MSDYAPLLASIAITGWVVAVVAMLQLHAIRASRRRIHERFTRLGRDENGRCQCPYCTGDADALAELAADYELQLAQAKGWLGK